MRIYFSFFLFLAALYGYSQQVAVGTVLNTTQVSAHDPVIIKQDSLYYVFCTGNGISVWSSNDLQNWRKEAPVFGAPPEWAVAAVPGVQRFRL